MFSGMKEFFLSKIFLRLTYIAGAYTASHFVAIFASQNAQTFLNNSGIVLQITDEQKLKTSLTALFLMSGEFVYHFIHEKFIIPHVAPQVNPDVSK